jgi:hypothetical protein
MHLQDEDRNAVTSKLFCNNAWMSNLAPLNAAQLPLSPRGPCSLSSQKMASIIIKGEHLYFCLITSDHNCQISCHLNFWSMKKCSFRWLEITFGMIRICYRDIRKLCGRSLPNHFIILVIINYFGCLNLSFIHFIFMLLYSLNKVFFHLNN